MYYLTASSTLQFFKDNFGERLKLKMVHDNRLVKGPWIDFTPGTWKYAWYKVHVWTLVEYDTVK